MTIETRTKESTSGGRLTRSKGFLTTLAVLVLITAVCAWISLGIGLYLDVERGTRIVLAVVAALATEALFWTVAALLGVSVFEARKRLWNKIVRRGALPPAPPA